MFTLQTEPTSLLPLSNSPLTHSLTDNLIINSSVSDLSINLNNNHAQHTSEDINTNTFSITTTTNNNHSTNKSTIDIIQQQVSPLNSNGKRPASSKIINNNHSSISDSQSNDESDKNNNSNHINYNNGIKKKKINNKKIKLEVDMKDENEGDKLSDCDNTKINISTVTSTTSNKTGSINSKKATDLDMAYNIFVRRIVDETLDRTVTFCEQPKDAIANLEEICALAFTDMDKSRHRIKIRSYLKACRRNSKKHNGKVAMKDTPSHMCSEKAYALANDAILRINNELQVLKMAKQNRIETYNDKISSTNSTNGQEESQTIRINDLATTSCPPITTSDVLLNNTNLTLDTTSLVTSTSTAAPSILESTQPPVLDLFSSSSIFNHQVAATSSTLDFSQNPFLSSTASGFYLPPPPPQLIPSPLYSMMPPSLLHPPPPPLPPPPQQTHIIPTSNSSVITNEPQIPLSSSTPPPAHTNSLMFPHNSIFSPFFSLSPASGSCVTPPLTNPNIILQKILNCHSIDPDFGVEILRNKSSSQEAVNSLRLLARYLLNKSLMVESYMFKDLQYPHSNFLCNS